MKLIEQKTLHRRMPGARDKVFEVDLCRLGDDRWVVNYRIGKAGMRLRDGSLTPAAVTEQQARQLYQDALQKRLNKGWLSGASPRPAPSPQAPPRRSAPTPRGRPTRPAGRSTWRRGSTNSQRTGRRAQPTPAPARPRRVLRAAHPLDHAPRRRAVLARLQAACGQPGATAPASHWPLTRVIWRAGELRITEAAPLIAQLFNGSELQDYCCAWALARIGEPAGQPQLRALLGHARHHLRTTAAAALLAILNGQDRQEVVDQLVAGLPSELRPHLAGEDPAPLQAELDAALAPPDSTAWSALPLLYLIDTKPSRAAVLQVARTVAFRPPAFQQIRRLFKLAELRRDGELFGLLGYRFATTRAMFRKGRWGSRVPDGAGRTRYLRGAQLRQALLAPDARAGYSSATRAHLRRHVWQTLRRLGELGDPDYVKMAVGVLLPFSDSDARNTRSKGRYDRRFRRWARSWWDRYAPFLAFNWILYGNGKRYQPGIRSWRCAGNFQPGSSGPVGREEAYPERWDEVPRGLIHLVHESRCEPVHDFAAAALRSMSSFTSALPDPALGMLVAAPYLSTAGLGAELIRQRYQPTAPLARMRPLLLALADCKIKAEREQAHRWLRDRSAEICADGVALAGLFGSRYGDTRGLARELVQRHPLAPSASQTLVAKLVTRLLACQSGELAQASDLATLLSDLFSTWLPRLGGTVLSDLAHHPLEPVQLLAARTLARVDGSLDPALVRTLVESPHEAVRTAGMQLFFKLPDSTLLGEPRQLLTLLLDRRPEIRDGIRPVCAQLAQRYPQLGGYLAEALCHALLGHRLALELPGFIVAVLQADLAAHLADLPEDLVWRLLRSQSSAAQEVAGLVLPQHIDPATTPVPRIVQLADNQIRAIRASAWTLCEAARDRLRGEPGEAVRLLDSRWPDTRAFAFRFFDNWEEGDLSPAILVSICDSVREDVRAYGRRLLSRHFQEEHGPLYLLKLSEHPSVDLQLHVTNYLEDYASGDDERLEELMPYFGRVLGSINRGRIARQRVHAFLRREALRSERAARAVVPLLETRAASIMVEDRATCIASLVALRSRWPAIPQLLDTVAPIARGGAVRAV